MAEQITLSKLEAAQRQLRFAIRLMFDNVDPVPVHTLAGAASGILSDLAKVDAEESWDSFAQRSFDLPEGEYFRIMRRTQNLLKHADKDAGAAVGVIPEETEYVIFAAVMNLTQLASLSTEEMVFHLWFLASHDPYLHDDSYDDANAARKVFDDMRDWPRDKRLEAGKRVLREWQTGS